MDGYPIHHVGIAVPSISEAATRFSTVSGAAPTEVETLPAQGVRVAFVGSLELLEPLDASSTVARFLERRGPGLHHIAYAVDDIASELRRLADEGYRLIDREPRPGAGGHLVAFLHPKDTGGVLVELVEP